MPPTPAAGWMAFPWTTTLPTRCSVCLSSRTSALVSPGNRSPSQNLWMLVRHDYTSPEQFLCPSAAEAGQRASLIELGGSGPACFINFPWDGGRTWAVDEKSGHCMSYSFIQPWSGFPRSRSSGDQWTVEADPRMPIGSDGNNGGTPTARPTPDGVPSPTFCKDNGINSANHNREGQNVLYADSHAKFEKTPYIGISNDNIYTSRLGGTAAGGYLNVNPIKETSNWDAVMIRVDTLSGWTAVIAP